MAGAGQKSSVATPSDANSDGTYTDILSRAKALLPQLRKRASKTEELRRLPPETERELHKIRFVQDLATKASGRGRTGLCRIG